MKSVAIQGIAGSYHEIAARNYYENEEIELIGCKTFRDVISTVRQHDGATGLLAIENTIAGSLLQNHELVRRSGLSVLGEYKLRIFHCLAALPGTALADVEEVDSHPMALMQCERFLDSMPSVRIVEKEDTASSARWIAENRLRGHAAICSRQAAETYGLEILAAEIETDKHNFTRFLVVGDPLGAKKHVPETEISENTVDKASVVFSLPHSVGSLSQVLAILSFYGMNLSKLQSFPMIGAEWEYLFYIDFTFRDYDRYKKALDAVIPLTGDLKILGEYENCDRKPKLRDHRSRLASR